MAIKGIVGLPEIEAGTRVGKLVAEHLSRQGLGVRPNDIFVVAQKVVSKAEGEVVRLTTVFPSARAREFARTLERDARVVEVVLRQSRRIIRMERGIVISETPHGFVCANAGVDVSNAPRGSVVLLPRDPDLSAAEIREDLERVFRVRVGVIVSDTFGRPWRQGLVDVALGISGVRALADCRGEIDSLGRSMRVTVMALADELAAAAGLVMVKTRQIPVVRIRGVNIPSEGQTGQSLLRPRDRDLFR